MLKAIVSLFKALCANSNPGEIAHAMACGLLLGLMPKNNLLWYLVFVFVFFIRFNKAAYLLMILFGSAISPALDPLFDRVGYAFLTIPSLSDFFGNLLDIPFVAFTKFNNSVVMGSFLIGLALYIPMCVLGHVLVRVIRKYAVPALRKAPVFKTISNLPLIAKIVDVARG
ncbi:MAG: TIGR03546 family protein [Treponema sp.]|nr:TIGR03546 family protein [Treponema sp.]